MRFCKAAAWTYGSIEQESVFLAAWRAVPPTPGSLRVFILLFSTRGQTPRLLK